MKNKKKYIISSIIVLILFLVAFFVPIPTNIMCRESPICWYRFGVYRYEYNAESGGNTSFGGNIYLYQKIGGIQEYLGLKEVECDLKN